MKVGFTGTRFGMTQPQEASFIEVMAQFFEVSEFHHGDCVGADDQAHRYIAWKVALVVIHPPIDETNRARCGYDMDEGDQSIRWMEPLTHFARNRNIVNMTDWLIATPYNGYEENVGGTWYTINFARKQKKNLVIIWPSGKITVEMFQ
jgi:hypothetical protein